MAVEGIRISHAIPGRVRLKIAKVRENPTLAGEIQTRLSAFPGVTWVEANPVTGSVLVLYETQKLSSGESLRVLLEPFTALFPGVDAKDLEAYLTQSVDGTSSPVSLTSGIATFFGTLNTSINHLTSGGMDLKILLPLTLFLLGVRGVLASEKLVFPTWYDLLWFSLGTFFMLNPRPGETRQ